MSTNSENQHAFEQHVASLTAKLGKDSSVPAEMKMPDSEKQPAAPESVAKVIHDLVGVVAQLSRVDKTIAQVTEGAPDEDEAKQWHTISLQALQCSRNMLAEKQAGYLKMLQALVPDAPEVPLPSGEAVTGPVAAPDHAAVAQSPAELRAPPGLSAPQPSVTKNPTWMGWSKEAVDACPEFVPQNASKNESAMGGGSLRQDLEMLRTCDPDCVMIVRKIKKLGFESPTILTQHFQKYGEVKAVNVAHSHVKPTAKRPNGRVRPAALGFVVMSDANGVEKALAAGEIQEVSGVMIEMSHFTAFSELEQEEKEE